MAKVVSVNAGLPRDIEWQGNRVRTAIWRDPWRARSSPAGSTSPPILTLHNLSIAYGRVATIARWGCERSAWGRSHGPAPCSWSPLR